MFFTISRFGPQFSHVFFAFFDGNVDFPMCFSHTGSQNANFPMRKLRPKTRNRQKHMVKSLFFDPPAAIFSRISKFGGVPFWRPWRGPWEHPLEASGGDKRKKNGVWRQLCESRPDPFFARFFAGFSGFGIGVSGLFSSAESEASRRNLWIDS